MYYGRNTAPPSSAPPGAAAPHSAPSGSASPSTAAPRSVPPGSAAPRSLPAGSAWARTLPPAVKAARAAPAKKPRSVWKVIGVVFLVCSGLLAFCGYRAYQLVKKTGPQYAKDDRETLEWLHQVAAISLPPNVYPIFAMKMKPVPAARDGGLMIMLGAGTRAGIRTSPQDGVPTVPGLGRLLPKTLVKAGTAETVFVLTNLRRPRMPGAGTAGLAGAPGVVAEKINVSGDRTVTVYKVLTPDATKVRYEYSFGATGELTATGEARIFHQREFRALVIKLASVGKH